MYCFRFDQTGISTGVFEVRTDGTFHEWTIFNQYPAGAAKIQIIDDMFMALRTQVCTCMYCCLYYAHNLHFHLSLYFVVDLYICKSESNTTLNMLGLNSLHWQAVQQA